MKYTIAIAIANLSMMTFACYGTPPPSGDCDGKALRPVIDLESVVEVEEIVFSPRTLIEVTNQRFEAQIEWFSNRVPPGMVSPTPIAIELVYRGGDIKVGTGEGDCDIRMRMPVMMRLTSMNGWFDETWDPVFVQGHTELGEIDWYFSLVLEKDELNSFRGKFRPHQVPNFANVRFFQIAMGFSALFWSSITALAT